MPMTRGDALARERLAQRSHQRDAAGDRRLEQQVDARRLGRVEQLLAEVREQLLVGGDTGLPDFSAVRISRRAGSMPPMTSTTTSIVGIGHDRLGVVGEHARGEHDVAFLGDVVHRDPCDLELHAGRVA